MFYVLKNNSKNKQKGFTLIELLVVIAIIGILASVILASLNTARDKGVDTAIKANLKTIQNQAEIFYSDNGNYGAYDQTWCSSGVGGVFSDPTVGKAINQVISLTGGGSFTRCIVCGPGGSASCSVSTPNAYVVSIQLKTGGIAGDNIPDSWCIDSSGNSKSFTYATGKAISDYVNYSNASCR